LLGKPTFWSKKKLAHNPAGFSLSPQLFFLCVSSKLSSSTGPSAPTTSWKRRPKNSKLRQPKKRSITCLLIQTAAFQVAAKSMVEPPAWPLGSGLFKLLLRHIYGPSEYHLFFSTSNMFGVLGEVTMTFFERLWIYNSKL